jgi:hypothetical protein
MKKPFGKRPENVENLWGMCITSLFNAMIGVFGGGQAIIVKY